MRKILSIVCVLGALAMVPIAGSSNPKSPDDRDSIVVVFKDGHQQSFLMSDVERIEFSTPKVSSTGSWPSHFVGKWKVGDGNGSSFFITLSRNGDAKKTIGSGHGTWTAQDGEARISWDDGWHDAIRRAGDGYEKAAFEPGKTFSDEASNVTQARRTEPI